MSKTAAPAGSAPDAEYRVFGWQVALLLLIAFALRLEFAFEPITDAFSWREASTSMMADNLPRNGWNPLWPEVSWTGDQPGYQGREFQFLTIFSALLNAVFGWSDWSGRLVAALFGTLTTYSMFRLIGLLFGRMQGLISAIFYAVLPGAIVIDSSYLPDPGMLAMEVTALWCLAEAVSPNAKRRHIWYALAGLIGTLAVLAKLPAATALIPACYLVWSSAKRGRKIHAMISLAGTLVLASIPVIAYYKWAVYLGNHYPPFHVAGSGWIWAEGLHSFWENGFYLKTFYWHTTTWLWGPVAVVLACLGLVSGHGNEGADERKPAAPWFLEFWLLGCALFYFVAALEVEDNSWNLHVFNPMIAALAARGCLALMSSTSRTTARLQILVLVVLSLVLGRDGVMSNKKPRFKDDYLLGMHLRILSKPGDLVIASGTETGSPLPIYYSRRRGWLFPTPEMAPNTDYALFSEDGDKAIASLKELAARGGRWFGVAKNGRDKNSPRKQFANHYRLLLEYLSTHARHAGETETHIIYDIEPLRQ